MLLTSLIYSISFYGAMIVGYIFIFAEVSKMLAVS